MAETARAVQRERMRCYRAAKHAIEQGLLLDSNGQQKYPVHLGFYVLERRILARLADRFAEMSHKRRRARKAADVPSPIGSPAGGG